MAYSNNYSKEELKALAIEKVQKSLFKVKQDVVGVFNESRFPDYLKFAANFHYFDVNNTMLVYMQRPTATYLASFKAWEKFSVEAWGDPNRPVFTSLQKGKGIGILVPYILKKKADSVSYGVSATKPMAFSYFDYHVVFVFDREQTNDIPTPLISWDLSKSKNDCIALFNAFKVTAPFDIVFSDKSENSADLIYESYSTGEDKGALVLNPKDRNNYYLLCSNIVNAYTKQALKSLQSEHKEDEYQKICECVAFMISSYFKLPTEQYSFFFAGHWCGGDSDNMIRILNTVQSSAHNIIDSLEEEMTFYNGAVEEYESFDNDDIFEFNGPYEF